MCCYYYYTTYKSTRCKNQKEKEFAEVTRLGHDPGKYLPPGILKIYYRKKLLFPFVAPIEHRLNVSVIHQCPWEFSGPSTWGLWCCLCSCCCQGQGRGCARPGCSRAGVQAQDRWGRHCPSLVPCSGTTPQDGFHSSTAFHRCCPSLSL